MARAIPRPRNLARGDMGAAGAAASAGKAGCGALCSMLGALGRTLADIFSDAEKTSQATLVLCLLLGLGNIIASMIAFASMHGIRVDLVELSGDTSNEASSERILSLARNFLSMQFGLFAIFVSSIVWGVLVLFDYFKFSVGKSFVLMATLYTVLLLLTHGVCVQTIQATTLKDLEGSWQSYCNAQQYEHLCSFDHAAETAKYEAAFVMAYMGIVGLVLYVFLMVYFYRQDLRAEITDKRKTTTTTSSSERYRADDAPDTEMGGAGGGGSPPRSAYDNSAYEDEAPARAPASPRFESAYADSPDSPPPPARVENPFDKPAAAGGGAGASPVAKNPFE